MKTKKKWKEMTPAEKKKERERIDRLIKKQEEAFKKTEAGKIHAATVDGRESHLDGPEMNVAIWGASTLKRRETAQKSILSPVCLPFHHSGDD